MQYQHNIEFDRRIPRTAKRDWMWLSWLVLVLIIAPGCAQVANLVHVVRGNTRPAEYKGLAEKKVAIVCGSGDGIIQDESANMLTLFVQTTLDREIKEVEFIPRDQITRWLDSQSAGTTNFVALGKGVGAEQVVCIDMKNMKMREGSTLYRGTADISVEVHDVGTGKVVYRKEIPDFAYPKVASASILDTNEAKFRGAFISIAAQKIASLFYAADATSEYALDATISSF